MRSAGPMENIVRASIQYAVQWIGARRAKPIGGVYVP